MQAIEAMRKARKYGLYDELDTANWAYFASIDQAILSWGLGQLPFKYNYTLATPVRRSTHGFSTHEMLDRSVSNPWALPTANNRATPCASHATKAIGKPCAGNPHLRFESGCTPLETVRKEQNES